MLESSSTQPPTGPGTVAQLTHVLNQAWAHPGEITERDVKTFAITTFADDSPAILHKVNGWLYGAGVLGNPPAPGTPRHTRIHHAATNAAATTVTGATPDYTAATRQIHPVHAPYTVAVTTTRFKPTGHPPPPHQRQPPQQQPAPAAPRRPAPAPRRRPVRVPGVWSVRRWSPGSVGWCGSTPPECPQLRL